MDPFTFQFAPFAKEHKKNTFRNTQEKKKFFDFKLLFAFADLFLYFMSEAFD